MYKETLLLLLSHEIKDAFSRLGGYLYLLKNKMISADENDVLIQRLEEEFSESESYINELLAWSKERRTKGNSITETNLSTMVRNIIKGKELKDIAAHKDIKFIYSPPNVLLKTDKTLYTIILKNMLKNALKFSEAHENIFLNIGLSNNKIITNVIDRGIGLAESKTTNNEQFMLATTRSHKGSGLALSLCSEVLKIEGGKIWANNNPDNKGASFYFSLPFY